MARDAERARIEQLVAALRAGHSDVIVVVGGAGSGKSMLCRQAAVAAEGMRVIAVKGVEREAELAYAGLLDVLSPLLNGALPRLAPVRARALRGALRLGDPAAPDLLAVGAGCLDLLTHAAAAGPVLVVADDADRLDRLSQAVLCYAARRLNGTPVGFVFAVGPDAQPIFAGSGLETLEIAGEADLARSLLSCRDVRGARRRWRRAASLRREPDAAEAARLAAGAAGAALLAGDVAAAVAIARDAAGRGDGQATAADVALGASLLLAGHGEEGLALVARAYGRADPAGFAAAAYGQCATWREEYALAHDVLEGALRPAGDRASPALPLLLAISADLHWRRGAWDVARYRARGAARVARALEQEQPLAYATLALATLDAVTGSGDLGRSRIAAAHETAQRAGAASLELHACGAAGLAELAAGDPTRAAAHLRRARALALRAGLVEPNVVRWAPDLIESQARAGAVDAAVRTLTEFDSVAARAGRTWAPTATARCRGLLARPGEVDAAFGEVERRLPAEASPFERGRSQLCWGMRLRRDGRRLEARMRLGLAREEFGSVGAEPWVEQATRELRVSGLRAARGAQAGRDDLTPQERRIGELVAQGHTNKEVAVALYISPKTVEFHLGRIYRKLGVGRRTQLTRALLLGEEFEPLVEVWDSPT